MTKQINKGTLLVIKSPPYYRDEYTYEVVSAGAKVIRANLQNSPTVRKSWTTEELNLLIKMGVIRISESPKNLD